MARNTIDFLDKELRGELAEAQNIEGEKPRLTLAQIKANALLARTKEQSNAVSPGIRRG
jgi:hypothetical protein